MDWMDLESEVSQRQIPYDITYMWDLKKKWYLKKKSGTNELICKTDTDSQT